MVDDEGGDTRGHPVLAQAADHHHLLQLVTVALPLTWRHTARSSVEGRSRPEWAEAAGCDSPTWQWAVLRLRGREPQVPVSWVLLEGHGDALEVGELGQLGDVVPAGVRQPSGTGVVHLLVLVQDLETHHTHPDQVVPNLVYIS